MIEYYLKFERLDLSKSKQRFDLTEYTNPIYDHLYIPFIYLNDNFKGISQKSIKKPNHRLVSNKGTHISGIFIPDITKPNIAFGDIKGTKDMLILILKDSTIEIFVAVGKKNIENSISCLIYDGELDAKMNELRQRAIRKINAAA